MMKPKIIILFVVLLVVAMFFIKRENLEGDSNVVTESTMTESDIKGPAGKFKPKIEMCENPKLFCANPEGLGFIRRFRSQNAGSLGAKCMSTVKKICAPI